MATTPTRAQIETASATVTGVPAAMLLSMIRQFIAEKGGALPDSYPDLETTIISFNETIKGKQLNAALDLIDELGSGEVVVKGDVEFSLKLERDALIGYCISVLYDLPADGSMSILFGFGFQRRTSQSIPAPAKW